MSLVPINSMQHCNLSFKMVFKSSAASLLDPPKTFLRMKRFFHASRPSVSFNEKSSPYFGTQSLIRNNIRLNNAVNCRRTFSSETGQSLSKWLFNKSDVWKERYENVIGLSSMKCAQDSLTESETFYLESKEKRKEIQIQVDALHLKLRKPRPPQSITTEALNLMEELSNAEKKENAAFSRLSTNLVISKDCETLLEKNMKYLCFIISVVGIALCLSIIGFSIKSSFQATELRMTITESVKKMERAYLITEENMKVINNTTSSLLDHHKECIAKSEREVYRTGEEDQSKESKHIENSEAVQEIVAENKNIQQLTNDKITDLRSSTSLLSNHTFKKHNELVNRLILSLEELTRNQKPNSNQLNNFSSIKDKLYAIHQNQQCLADQLKEWQDKRDNDDGLQKQMVQIENRLNMLHETYSNNQEVLPNKEQLKWMLSSAAESAAVATASSVLIGSNDLKSMIHLEHENVRLNEKLEKSQIINWGFVGLLTPIIFYSISKIF